MAYQVTGNEYLSLPTIRENDGAVEGVTFLYMSRDSWKSAERTG